MRQARASRQQHAWHGPADRKESRKARGASANDLCHATVTGKYNVRHSGYVYDGLYYLEQYS